MAGKRFQGDHGCCRDRADGSCALAMVRRLSEERVRRRRHGHPAAQTVLQGALRFSPVEYGRRLVAELWMYPDGSRIPELST